MNTTYYLGAGASAGKDRRNSGIMIPVPLYEYNEEGIPIVAKTVQTFDSFINNISQSYWFNNVKAKQGSVVINPDMNIVRAELPIYDILLEIREELLFHETFDTIARKYWLANDLANLNQLKYVMNIFYIWLQSRKTIDKRYDKFFSIMLNKVDNKSLLPGNLKFISWNYNLQMELAILSYFKNPRIIDHVFNYLGIIPYFGNSLHNIQPYGYNPKQFHIVKLNGTAGIFNDVDYPFSIYDIDNTSTNFLSDRVDNYSIQSIIENSLKNKGIYKRFEVGTLQFAFEKEERQNIAIDTAESIMKETSTLVIIGYSFPSFNREIDVRILKNLPEDAEIILQDINPPLAIIQDILSRLGKKDVKISDVSDVSQFHIPFDFQHERFIPKKEEIGKMDIFIR